MNKRTTDLLQIVFIYLVIGVSGYFAYIYSPFKEEILSFLFADLVMTVVCFLFSVIKKNSSVYDAYWSVIPFYFVVAWTLQYYEYLTLFHYIAFLVVSLWSWRLTLNWVRSWSGFEHEDWRYIDLARKTKAFYPFVNFLGIHLFPTVMVFAGMWPLFFTLGKIEFNIPLFAAGVLTGLVGIFFEFQADNELAKFRRRANPKKEDLLNTGIWSRSRNPNYLGEMLFWVGLAIIGTAFGAPYYAWAGSIAMISMFLFISIPMKEKRMEERRPDFGEHKKKVPLLIPKIGKG